MDEEQDVRWQVEDGWREDETGRADEDRAVWTGDGDGRAWPASEPEAPWD
jgi:hypothetical protein